MWIARDKCGVLCLYNIKPSRNKDNEYWYVKEDTGYSDNWKWEHIQVSEDLFSYLKWEDEPIEVEIAEKPHVDIALTVEPLPDFSQFQNLLETAITHFDIYHDRCIAPIVEGLKELIETEGAAKIYNSLNSIIYDLYNHNVKRCQWAQDAIKNIDSKNLTKENLLKLLLITKINFIG